MIKQLTAAVALMLAATAAQAWGAREQGVLLGIAGTLFAQQVLKQPQQPEVVVGGTVGVGTGQVYGQVRTQPQPMMQPPTMYIPAPPRCTVVPVYDYYGRYVAQQTLCNW
jgi:hypothetical protein